MHDWILQHDDRWSFIALYVSLAVVLSLWISLFWLVVLVAVHFAFELVRQGAGGARGGVRVGRAVWEVKLDVALVLFALALSLYMEVMLGLLGLQGLARAGAAANASMRAGGRVLAWERAIRGVLLSIDDAAQVARVAVTRNAARARAAVAADGSTAQASLAAAAAAPALAGAGGARAGRPAGGSQRNEPPQHAVWRGAWSVGDHVAVSLWAACVLLIAAAPPLTGGSYADAAAVLRQELRPLPQRVEVAASPQTGGTLPD